MEDYRVLTLKDLIEFVESDKELFPKGLDTVVMSGDFEGNYVHEKHECQYMREDSKYGTVLCLGYEMHENYYDEMEIEDEEEYE